MNKNTIIKAIAISIMAFISCDKAFAQWNTYRGPGNNATYISLAIAPDETKYVAFQDGNSNALFTDSREFGQFGCCGSPLFSAGNAIYESLAIDNNGTPYVAYQDGGDSNKCTVMMFNGLSWVALGTVRNISRGCRLRIISNR